MGAGDLTAVQVPDRVRAAVAAPQNVAGAIAVEVASADNLPFHSHSYQIEVAAADLASGWCMADVLSRGELSYIVEEPRHCRVAIDILPENVVMTVAIDVAGAEDVPAGIGETDVLD